ncbi:MAG: ferrous iron transport protein B [Anaerolineales bacterium]|nr:ferrous iron transport protein B [Anaerolineales bacterium]
MSMQYAPEIEAEIKLLTAQIEKDEHLCSLYPPRWLAIQLLEGDLTLLNHSQANSPVMQTLQASQTRLIETFGPDLDITLPDQRFQFVQSILSNTLQRQEDQVTFSDKLDRFFANRYLGLPVFLFIMYLVFNIVQNVSAPYLDWIDSFFNQYLAGWIINLLAAINAPAWLNSLLIDGIIAGVGGVLVFVPGLFTMYSMLSIMEQTGYMSRAAYVMDRFMSKIGLHGKSFIPMILGFGCNVPAIYATRTIEKRETRLLTGLLIPFMSCSARLPVYLIFGIAFFPERANLVIFLLYLIGILVASGIAIIVSRLVFQGKSLSIMVLELPSYQKPDLKTMLNYAGRQTSEFIHKAGTFILAFSVLLWFLLNLPWGVENTRDSYFGKLGGILAPTLAPAGFGNWEASGSLVTGLVAKELVVSSLAQVYEISDEYISDQVEPNSLLQELGELGIGFSIATVDAGKSLLEAITPGIPLFPADPEPENPALSRALQRSFTPLSAASYLVFVLLYIPCVAVIGAQRQEFGWKWAGLSVLITMVVPWVLAVLVYQGGRLVGLQ